MLNSIPAREVRPPSTSANRVFCAAFRADRVIADRDEAQRMAYESRVRPPLN